MITINHKHMATFCDFILFTKIFLFQIVITLNATNTQIIFFCYWCHFLFNNSHSTTLIPAINQIVKMITNLSRFQKTEELLMIFILIINRVSIQCKNKTLKKKKNLIKNSTRALIHRL